MNESTNALHSKYTSNCVSNVFQRFYVDVNIHNNRPKTTGLSRVLIYLNIMLLPHVATDGSHLIKGIYLLLMVKELIAVDTGAMLTSKEIHSIKMDVQCDENMIFVLNYVR